MSHNTLDPQEEQRKNAVKEAFLEGMEKYRADCFVAVAIGEKLCRSSLQLIPTDIQL